VRKKYRLLRNVVPLCRRSTRTTPAVTSSRIARSIESFDRCRRPASVALDGIRRPDPFP
jgi:hypothetical protein